MYWFVKVKSNFHDLGFLWSCVVLGGVQTTGVGICQFPISASFSRKIKCKPVIDGRIRTIT